MNAIINGTILLPDAAVEDGALLYENGTICGVVHKDDIPADATCIDAHGGYAMPGLIDLHIHGFNGYDVCDGDPEGLRQMGKALQKEGVTGWLATTMTTDKETLHRAFTACRKAVGEAGLLGIHAEGPYINPKKTGAQNAAHAVAPNLDFIKEYADVVKILTLAPEMDDNFTVIHKLKQDTNVVPAMGHTTADYDTATAAVKAGIAHATHLFNAMPPLHHREPGAVGAAFTTDVSCELIADNHHIHPALYEMVWRQKGALLCLVTDCLSAAGTPDGMGTLCGQPITVQDGVCRLADGTLAGSTLRLWEAVRNLHTHSHIPLWECVNCASANPAAVLGLANKGRLEAGCDADILITDRNLRPIITIAGGKIV